MSIFDWPRLLSLLSVATSLGIAQDAPRTNVLVFLADDLGWRDLGCEGSTFYETPNIDALAASGVRFTQGYATCPVCSPTRASMLSGKYPARMDTTDWFGGRRKGKLLPAEYTSHLPLEEATLAEALAEAGYRTGFFGKWHLGAEGFWPTDQGFDTNVAGFRLGMPPAGYFSPYKMPTLTDGPEGEHLTERLTNEACAWMEAVKDEPFLLYLSYYAVHTPLQTKPEYEAKYEKKRTEAGLTETTWGQERERKVREVQQHAVYAGMVQSLDESVGRVLGKLAELGLDENTLVVFTSDNGGLSTSEGHPTSNLPLRAGKGWVYEGGIREPFLFRLPGVTESGTTSGVPITSADVYPTVLDALGLDARPEQHADGVSLVPLLSGQGEIEPRALYWHYPHYGNQGGAPAGAIREGDWKLVEWFEDGSVELFHLGRDRGEEHDRSADEPERVRRLRGELARWRDEVGANMPTANPDWDEGK